MAKNHTGHSQNLVKINSLISCLAGYGDTYHPSNPQISVAGLQTKQAETEAVLEAVIRCRTACNNAINRRQLLFGQLNEYAIRVVGAYESCGVDAASLEEVRMIRRRMVHYKPAARAARRNAEAISEAKRAHTPAARTFQDRIDQFRALTEAVSADARYTPFETDITIDRLRDFLRELISAQHDVADAKARLADARSDRNRVLYDGLTGLNQLARLVKQYVKSAFGSQSDAYRRLSGIYVTRL